MRNGRAFYPIRWEDSVGVFACVPKHLRDEHVASAPESIMLNLYKVVLWDFCVTLLAQKAGYSGIIFYFAVPFWRFLFILLFKLQLSNFIATVTRETPLNKHYKNILEITLYFYSDKQTNPSKREDFYSSMLPIVYPRLWHFFFLENTNLYILHINVYIKISNLPIGGIQRKWYATEFKQKKMFTLQIF